MLEGFQPVSVDIFGSLVTLIDRSDLPVNLSPECQNVEFYLGGVQSRVGLQRRATQATSRVNGISDYVTPSLSRYRILLTDNGTLWYETGEPTGTFTSIATGLGRISSSAPYRMKAAQFGDRIFIAFSDGKVGQAQAMHWNGTYLDSVSQGGPCTFPTATYENAASIGQGFSKGDHRFTICFETRAGYISPTPEMLTATFTASDDGDCYSFSVIPTGPPDVIRRRIYVSPSSTASANPSIDASWKMYTHPKLWLNDNTSTQLGSTLAGVGVDDQTLISYNDVIGPDDLAFIQPLPPAAGLATYSGRLVAWGFLNELHRVVTPSNLTDMAAIPGNLDFDGGSYLGANRWDHWLGGDTVWTDITAVTSGTMPGATNWAVKVTGKGSAAAACMHHEKPLKNFLNVFSVQTFAFRIRAKRSSLAQAGVVLRVEAKNSGASVVNFDMSSDLTSEFQWHTGTLCTAAQADGATKATLKISVVGTMPSSSYWICWDKIQVYPLEQPYYKSRLMVSRWNDPETFIFGQSIIPINERDGQAIMACYELRGVLRVAKERSTFSVVDTGGEPDTWAVERLSDTIGCMSIWGVGMGENWAVLADEDGLYLDDGGTLKKLSQEIQPDWDRINIAYGHTIHTAVDTQKKRVYVLAPRDSATEPNTLFVMDYIEGLGDPLDGRGSGRKWTIWTTPTVLSMGYFVRDSGVSTMFFAGGANSSSGYSLIQDPTETLTYDEYYDGANQSQAFSAYYDTASVGQDAGRSLFGYLSLKARGTGELQTSTISPGGIEHPQPRRRFALVGDHDLEIPMMETETQIGIRIKTTGLNDSFSCRRLTLFLKSAPFSRMRGHNK